MVYTAKQHRALASAAPALKATLARAFQTQNGGRVPGESRDFKQSRAAQNHQRWLTRGARQGGGRRNNAAFAQMLSSTSGVRGVLPSFAPGMRNWSQTPASSNVIAPRGFGFYDAFAHGPHETATALSVGPATPIAAPTIAVAITSSTNNVAIPGIGTYDFGVRMMIVFPGPCACQAVSLYCSNSIPTDPTGKRYYTSPPLNNPGGAPEAAMATRCSLRIRNITQLISQGGTVRTLRVTTGFALADIEAANQDFVVFCDHVRNHERTRTYSGASLADNCQINCTVVYQPRATTFLPFENTSGAGSPFHDGLLQPTLTPIILLFEPFGAPAAIDQDNTYEVTIRSQFLAHYVQGSMLANLAMSIPDMPTTTLSKHRNDEENKGSMLHKISDFVQNVGPYVPGIARGMRAAYQAYRPTVQAAIGNSARMLPMLGM